MQKFKLGQVVMTAGVNEQVQKLGSDYYVWLMSCLTRHSEGDWGCICEEDKGVKEQSLIAGDRVLSAYEGQYEKIWIITEWDRSVTTILFPEEY